jgi:hypothetical protein
VSLIPVCNQVYSIQLDVLKFAWLVAGLWFSLGALVSTTNTTGWLNWNTVVSDVKTSTETTLQFLLPKKKDGNLVTDTTAKVNMVNGQFQCQSSPHNHSNLYIRQGLQSWSRNFEAYHHHIWYYKNVQQHQPFQSH